MNLVTHDLLDQAIHWPAGGIIENRGFAFDLLAMDRAVTCSGCVAKCPHTVWVMEPKHGLHEMCQRVIVEVRRNVSNIKMRIGRGWRSIHSVGKPWGSEGRA